MNTVTGCLVAAVMFCGGLVAGMMCTLDDSYEAIQAESMFLGAEAGAKAQTEHYFNQCTRTLQECSLANDELERRFNNCAGLMYKGRTLH